MRQIIWNQKLWKNMLWWTTNQLSEVAYNIYIWKEDCTKFQKFVYYELWCSIHLPLELIEGWVHLLWGIGWRDKKEKWSTDEPTMVMASENNATSSRQGHPVWRLNYREQLSVPGHASTMPWDEKFDSMEAIYFKN